MGKEGAFALIRLPSGEMRKVSILCRASIGQVSNVDHENVNYGKAGRMRNKGWRPTVRGSVMNPNDHPHGGGEGKSPVAPPFPLLTVTAFYDIFIRSLVLLSGLVTVSKGKGGAFHEQKY